MVRMCVAALTRKPDAQEATLVLKDVTGCLALAFVIPMNEANRLSRVLGHAACTCAPVYELLLELAGHGGLTVRRTVLDGDAEGICAALVIERDGVPIEVSCHPADAVAVALRTDSPIYALAGAMDHACRVGQPRTDGEGGSTDLARGLRDVRPGDFGPPAAP